MDSERFYLAGDSPQVWKRVAAQLRNKNEPLLLRELSLSYVPNTGTARMARIVLREGSIVEFPAEQEVLVRPREGLLYPPILGRLAIIHDSRMISFPECTQNIPGSTVRPATRINERTIRPRPTYL